MHADLIKHARAVGGQVLARGRYAVFLTATGAGYSSWNGLALTRWNADPIEQGEGFFLYVRDLESGVFWCAGQQPTPKIPDQYTARLSTDRAELWRMDDGIETRLELCIAPDADLELRRLTLRNGSLRPRRLELTSYAEVVLNAWAADAAHPAFSKLFIQTEWVPELGVLLARRRPRAPEEPACWLFHTQVGTGEPQYETDRVRFIGRGGSRAEPQALSHTEALSGTVGNVLDPVFSLRQTVELPVGGQVELVFVLGAAEQRDLALAAAARYRSAEPVAAAFATTTGENAAVVCDSPRRPPEGASSEANPSTARLDDTEALQFWNGYGGFSADGSEYVIRLTPEASGRLRLPPQPWVNIIANPSFGFLASETGAGYTWSQNSRENRLTPWSNDPVLDPPGEVLYLRDEDQARFWSLTPGPVPQPVACEIRHGFGYSRYRQVSHDLEQDVWLFAAREEPVKMALIRLHNPQQQPRRLSLFSYTRLVLGVLPDDEATALVIEQDGATGALLAENRNRSFSGRVAFAATAPIDSVPVYVSGDRATFIGPQGSPAQPAALVGDKVLNGRLGAGLVPCFALQVTLRLEPGATIERAFLLGEADSHDDALRLINHYRSAGAATDALAEVQKFWQHQLAAVQIKTPAPALDLMINGWAAYQTLSCRLWGRSAFYQSGGAFGFRDQLQDAAALVYHDPELARQQLLRHAARQFVEGDVLHWWHPRPLECGIRTRFSDDLLWLPYLAAFYGRATGDWNLFNEPTRFLKARLLEPGEDEAFLTPEPSDEIASLYTHCCRALDRSLTQGTHGLPLMGTGDWNDGMNRVGREGRGESVWMGFFLYAILGDFIPICGQQGDHNRARRYAAFRTHLATALNTEGWDGQWYRRAWYDSGAVLGSTASDECRIDALAQAWAVISKAAPAERAETALNAVVEQLIESEDGLIRLLTPPFEHTPHDPGYIKGYVAGVRENGGQYTHAALWVVRALAELGRRNQAAQLLEKLTPVHRTRTAEAVAVYRLEPFSVAADIYGIAPHIGRGGWSGYTGAAGWLLRVTLESILGLERVEGHALRLRPCIPDEWPSFELRYRLPGDETIYDIEVGNPDGQAQQVVEVEIDEQPGRIESGAAYIPLFRDGRVHSVRVRLAGLPDNTSTAAR